MPPLTHRNLPHLRELMRTLPLVSRSRRSMAYATIPAVPKLVLVDDEADDAPFVRFTRVVAGAGRPVERCELDMSELTREDVVEPVDALMGAPDGIKELWVVLSLQATRWVFSLGGPSRSPPCFRATSAISLTAAREQTSAD